MYFTIVNNKEGEIVGTLSITLDVEKATRLRAMLDRYLEVSSKGLAKLQLVHSANGAHRKRGRPKKVTTAAG
jgi:hypothetical protein